MLTIGNLIEFLETVAPLERAADWDNVGLLLGDRSTQVSSVMTCLSVTPETVAEALEGRAELIVTHHPMLFHAVKRLTSEAPDERMVLDLVRGGVAVYSAHTAFDNATGGINDAIARLIQLRDSSPLRPQPGPQHFKIVVFVPPDDLAKVADALFEAGAGKIGDYSQCSFRLAGTGTFFGSEAAQPTVGQKGRREQVSELRLEVICPENRLAAAISLLRKAHSYEEPAFDVYPLHPSPTKCGAGRIGRLPKGVPLIDFAGTVKTVFRARCVQVVGEPGMPVERVAIVCGSGGDFVQDASEAAAHVLLTGEARFHDCLAAKAAGLGMVLVGHHASERLGVEELAGTLQREFPDLSVWASRNEQDPLSVA
jgi:dinuclear metal center YbgI/SA1388 family protein